MSNSPQETAEDLRALQLAEIAKMVDQFRQASREINGRSEIQTAIAITLSQLSAGQHALGQGLGLVLKEVQALKTRMPEPTSSILVP